MGLFASRKPRIVKGTKGDMVTFQINYDKVGLPKEFKTELLKKLIDSSLCLAVINSRLMYQEQEKQYSNIQPVIARRISDLGFECKVMPVRRKLENKLFGFAIRQDETHYYTDHVIGTLIESQDLGAVEPILEPYNHTYYIDCKVDSRDEVMEIFSRNFDEEDRLREVFRFYIFDDSFIKHIIIYCKKEDAEGIEKLLHNN